MLHISKAGPYLDILERFYIFRGTGIEVKGQTYGIYIYIYIYIYIHTRSAIVLNIT